MSDFVLEWSGSATTRSQLERQRVATAQELKLRLTALQELAAESPFMAELVAPSGASLGLGLGRSSTVLAFKSSPSEPPFFVSNGHEAAADQSEREHPVIYRYQGEWTEFSLDAVIPLELGLKAMDEFLATGQRPVAVDWTEV